MMEGNKNYHNLSWEKVVRKLDSDDEKGLSEGKAKLRQEEFGKNVLPEEKAFSKLKIFLEQFSSPLIYILVIAGIITLLLEDFSDSAVIFGAIILNTIVGFFQENKATETLRKLKKVVKIKAEVIRDGNTKIVDSEELVPGDIIILNPGDKVPADARIIEAYNLKINEMALTGEWLAAEKHSRVLPQTTPLADRNNMVYMGTIIENGKAKAVVTSTGIDTEIGKVAEMVKETKEEKTPLQKKLARLAKFITGIIVFVCLVIFVEGMLTGNSFLEMFTVSVAVAVAAIPEGLPVAMTVILALGMQRILSRGGLVRKLLAAETLGSTSIICTDKTKTLTEGKMKVSKILTGKEIIGGKSGNNLLALEIAAFANEGFIENPKDAMGDWKVQGRPTDKALLEAAIEAGINKVELEKERPKIDELPFNTINKYIATLYSLDENQQILYISGAPEKILSISQYLQIDEEKKEITDNIRKKIEDRLEEMTRNGLRVVAVAYKRIAPDQKNRRNLKDVCEELTFVGLIGLKDPLRKEVKEAIRVCKSAGMSPILVTGDHKLTARAIAEEIGLKTKEENIIEGKELEKMSDKELTEKIKDVRIFARVEPRHKMRIIGAWQEKGKVVAMTGDGINDAPALRKADIGVALGSGTEVAKGASDLILLTDNFSVIVAAVEEGRTIVDNIRKVITYLLSDSFTEVILIGASLLLGFPIPVLAVQILWVNLIEDGLPDIALAFEPKERDLMAQKPHDHDIPLLTKEMKVIIFIIGILTDLVLLGLFFWLWKQNHDINYVRTMVFGGLAINSLFYVFSCKSLRRNIWHINPFSNKFLVGAVAVGLIMLVLAIYLPILQVLLKTAPLYFYDWLILFSLGIINIVLIEITKYHFIVRHQTY